jgi:hypothetical protein
MVSMTLAGCRTDTRDIYERFSSGSILIDGGVLFMVTLAASLVAYGMSGSVAVMIVCTLIVYFTIDFGGPISAMLVLMTGAGTISVMQDMVKKAKEVEKARDEMREEHRRYTEREKIRRGGIYPKDD